jgi:hypothetical protein
MVVKKSRMLKPHIMKEGEELERKKAPDNGIRIKASKSGNASHKKVIKKAFGK